ncbi:MAG: Gfo/Idh/MocA family oxidoreductase [Chthoniobacterales bacterium]
MKNFRWGLIGYGDLAEKRVAAALQQSGELPGVWGRSATKTADFAARHHIPKACSTLEELLALDIDGIYICTPPVTHAEYTKKAALAGHHVMVEKPMATSVRECEEMISITAQQGVTLGVAYYRRTYPKMIRIRELIEQGILGKPVWVNIALHSWFDPSTDNPQHWRVEKQLSGKAGALADIGVHRFDLLDFWLGESKVVHAAFTNLVHDYDVEDGASVILQLANGAPVHAFFSWNAKTWMDRFEIVGTEGKIIAEPLDSPSLVIIRGDEREELSIPAPDNPHLVCVQDFVAACREGRRPLCDGETGLRTNALLETAIRTAGRYD